MSAGKPKAKKFAKKQDIENTYSVVLTSSSKITKVPSSEYVGGGADDSHIHQYSGGFHLKLGKTRYNLVQKGKFYKTRTEEAIAALEVITGARALWAGEMIQYINLLTKDYLDAESDEEDSGEEVEEDNFYTLVDEGVEISITLGETSYVVANDKQCNEANIRTIRGIINKMKRTSKETQMILDRIRYLEQRY